MNLPPSLVLQNRWRVVCPQPESPYLLYYGVRNPPHNRTQFRSISPDLSQQIEGNGDSLDTTSLCNSLVEEVTDLFRDGVLVPPEQRLRTKTNADKQVCVRCVNNDYLIPGLEFNTEGVCAICQCYQQEKQISPGGFATVSEAEVLKIVSGNTSSRFDAMVFYTGGKDSTYMLWLLAKQMGLRVLAAFWNMPYCSNVAYENMARAKQQLEEVEFVEWTLPRSLVRQGMLEKWHEFGWPCLCPTAAFPILYPLAVHLKIPYVFLGLEDIQTSVMDYVLSPSSQNSGVPTDARSKTIRCLRARAFPRPLKQPIHWTDEMSNYHAATVNAMPELFRDLAEIVEQAEREETFHLPSLVRLETNQAYATWDNAKNIIGKETGWQAPDDQNSLLHTSCAIEPVKDYLQCQRFRNMRTVFMPQSIVEISAAVFFGLCSREEALKAVEEFGYSAPPAILNKLAADLGVSPEMVDRCEDELAFSMAEWARLQQNRFLHNDLRTDDQ